MVKNVYTKTLATKLAFLMTFIGSLAIHAQTLPFKQLTLGKGQDVNMVVEILQDSRGFMWFGTSDGLVRHDGYRFKHYPFDPETKYPMKAKQVKSLLESPSGNIWMISGKYLLLHNPRLDTFYTCTELGSDSLFRTGSIKYHDALLQDSLGFLWLRTMNGLFKIREKSGNNPFGVQSYKHDQRNEFTLSSNRINVTLLDSQHRLWIGTENGLNLYDRENDRIIRLNQRWNSPITSLCETASGKICIGTRKVGLLVYDPESQEYSNYQPKLQNPSSIAGKFVKQIVRDGQDNIWLLAGSPQTNMMNLQRFDPKQQVFHSYFEPFLPTSLTPSNSFLLYVDKKGLLWVVTGKGLKRFNPYKNLFADIFQREPVLQDWGLLFTFYEDHSGVIWIGAISQGVLKYSSTSDKFRYYPPLEKENEQHITFNFLRPIYEDSRGYLWMRTAYGTNRYAFDKNDEPQKTVQFPFHGFSFFEDERYRLWISTGKDLKGFDLKTERLISSSVLPNSDNLTYLAKKDREGWYWCPSRGDGLRRYNPITGEIVHFPNIKANPVMLEDIQGNIWFNGSNGLKVYNHNTGEFSFYLQGMQTVYSIWDSDSTMWVTTSGRGLFLFNIHTGESKCYSPKNGFPTLRPISIFKDIYGELWMSSDVGIIKFNPKTEISQVYDESDGLPGTVFAYGSLRRSNGEFFFPLWEGGFVRFHPDSLKRDTIAPRPAIVDFKLSNKPVTIGGMNSPLSEAIWSTNLLNLKYHQNNFTLGFTAFHYGSPEHNRFLYKLEGVDEIWNDPGKQRAVNFVGLRPGKYIFHLKAANHDGVWSNPVSLEIRIKSPWWATWWAYMVYFLMAAIGVYVFFTYRKRQWKLQSQLELKKIESDRLKELDSIKTRLYINLTHEFRTPLTLILGKTTQLAVDSRKLANRTWEESLRVIRRNGQILLRLVNQLLDLSKLESGAVPVNLVQDDIIMFLKYLQESFHSLAEEKNIALEFSSEPDELVMDFDPEKLREIVYNLLSNAIKFTPEGGEISVTFRQVGEEKLELEVKDSGPGIPHDKLPYIFDRFYQADTKTTKAIPGTGVGLAITKELVSLLGGNIFVKSENDKGSLFIVTLPIHREAPIQTTLAGDGVLYAPTTRSTEITSAKANGNDLPIILIVEDNEDVIRYLQSILSEQYEHIVARNGSQGIVMAIETIPDLIISDVMMPEIHGYELCKTLKQDERTGHIPIILLTAKADSTSRLEGLESGADAYLAKPFDQEELLIRIRKLLELRRKLWENFSINYWLTGQKDKYFQAEDSFLKKLLQTLEDHFSDQEFDIPQLCKALHTSRAQLYRKVKALTGKPVGHLLRSFRLQKARTLLETTDLSVSQVALETGFKHLTHFSRAFQEEFGVNPSETRK